MAPNAEWAKFLKANRAELAVYLAENFPEADAEKIIRMALAEVAVALPHYKYSGDEGDGFLHYIRRLLVFHASAGTRRSVRAAAFGNTKGKESVLNAWRELYGMFQDVGILALEELERATANRLHWQVFQRICLQGEKPKNVAVSVGKSMAMVYQTKKRMGDRCRSIVKKLYANLQSQLEAEAAALSRDFPGRKGPRRTNA